MMNSGIKENLEKNLMSKGLEIKPDVKILKVKNLDDLFKLQDGQVINVSMPARIWKPKIKDIFFYFEGLVCVGPYLDWPLGRIYPFLTKLPEFDKNGIFYFGLNKFYVKPEDIKFENDKLICNPALISDLSKNNKYKKSRRNGPYCLNDQNLGHVMFSELPGINRLGKQNYEKIEKLIGEIQI